MLTCYDCDGFEAPELCIKFKRFTDEDNDVCYMFRGVVSGLTRNNKIVNRYARAVQVEAELEKQRDRT